jgi:hypothetical protein
VVIINFKRNAGKLCEPINGCKLAAKGVEWVWIVLYYAYYIATTCLPTETALQTVRICLECRTAGGGEGL